MKAASTVLAAATVSELEREQPRQVTSSPAPQLPTLRRGA